MSDFDRAILYAHDPDAVIERSYPPEVCEAIRRGVLRMEQHVLRGEPQGREPVGLLRWCEAQAGRKA